MYILGIDMSLTSPGIALYNEETAEWQLRCFANRNREENIVYGPLVVWNRLQSSSVDIERYIHIIDQIMSYVKDKNITRIVLEGYAYAANSAHSAKLHEITGILKYTLTRHFPLAKWTIFAPTSWRKIVHGNGHASKQSAIDHVQASVADIPAALGISSGSPLTDICDAVCLVYAIL
jgi:Holliday junction resolvasome RuvABC endonuclease subunit